MADTQNGLRKRNVWIALLLPLLAVVVLSLLLTSFLNSLLGTAGWVEHTEKVIAQAFRVEKLAIDMETGLRGFQLSRDAAFLEPFENASRVIPAELERLETLVGDNPQQQQRVALIRSAWNNWNQFASDVVRRGEAGAEINSPVINGRGKALMDDTRREIGWFLEQEELLREVRRKELKGIERNVALYRAALLWAAGVGIGLYVLKHVLTRIRGAKAAPLPETPQI